MKALALLSGGLDSSLAVKIVLEQGIEVTALKFTSPFCQCDSGRRCHAAEISREFGIELMIIEKGQDYLDVVRNPRFGRGSGMNPCIDCRIFMLRRAKKIAEEIGARFIFTGEVLGQRPMSQQRRTLELIEMESGLDGKLLRPLSAKLLPPTEAERLGWIDREQLLGLSGRGRRRQIELASERGMYDYPCPAGGCLLTVKEFSARLRDFLRYSPESLTYEDVALLRVGRHFRIDRRKLIVGRDEGENRRLTVLADDRHLILEPVDIPGPTGLLEQGDSCPIRTATAILARYSDHEGRSAVMVRVTGGGDVREFSAAPIHQELIDRLRVQNLRVD